MMNPFDSYMLNKARRLILLRASMLAQDAHAQLGKL